MEVIQLYVNCKWSSFMV